MYGFSPAPPSLLHLRGGYPGVIRWDLSVSGNCKEKNIDKNIELGGFSQNPFKYFGDLRGVLFVGGRLRVWVLLSKIDLDAIQKLFHYCA